MRRVATALVVVLAAGAAAFALAGAKGGGEDKPRYWVELDNAFGLVTGGDLKVAGVRAGKITKLKLDRRTRHALVAVRIDEDGFGSLRRDVTCAARPQSLIGEYFLDCLPGTDRHELRDGATIPVTQTSSTVAPDLVNNVMRRPYRERLSIIVNSLGGAVAGNAENLNATLRRGVPALRETDRVLKLLADQNTVLADLTTNADKVIGDLADNRRDVGRWVVKARDTARASAERRQAIAAGFHKLPTFLRELRPTMSALGRVADTQGPALRNLAGSAGQLERLFDDLQPYADANRPALRALANAARTGRDAVKVARPTVGALNEYAQGTPELAKNLAIILEHLDDRDHAVESDPRSPGGQGYTGLEALLQYVYDQTLSTNIHDGEVHFLKAFPFESACSNYADIKAAKELAKQCAQNLGPNLPGINYVDQSAPAGYDGADRAAQGGGDEGANPLPIPLPGNAHGGVREGSKPAAPGGDGGKSQAAKPGGDAPPPAPPKPGGILDLPALPELPPVPGGGAVPKTPAPPALPRRGEQDAQNSLLDYLLR